MNDLDQSSLTEIVSFIGSNQYRFVAAINRRFHDAYLHAFPDNKETEINASTVSHAKICFEEWGMYSALDEDQRQDLCCSAAKHGSLPALLYLCSVNCVLTEWVSVIAAEHGHLHIIEWADRNGSPWNLHACTLAARNGHLHVMQWARTTHGCEWSHIACETAARNAQLHILQWAHESGYQLSVRVCAAAAENGHLHVLKWAHKNGCPWDEWVCTNAAENGHLHVLKWAREYACPWDEGVCVAAAEHGHLHVLKWARAHGAPWTLNKVIDRAQNNGHADIIQWIDDLNSS